jgi:hypothetical protein
MMIMMFIGMMMIKKEAIKILLSHREKKIKHVYDVCDNVSEAILTLHSNFEYPEWSWRFVGEFLENYSD